MSSSSSKDINLFIQQQRPPILRDLRELIGTLESVEPVGGGLVKVRIAGIMKCLPEELEPKLRPLMGRRISVLRIGDSFSVAEIRRS